jgi:hypothetical protein
MADPDHPCTRSPDGDPSTVGHGPARLNWTLRLVLLATLVLALEWMF